jgi:hypothetical protein
MLVYLDTRIKQLEREISALEVNRDHRETSDSERLQIQSDIILKYAKITENLLTRNEIVTRNRAQERTTNEKQA